MNAVDDGWTGGGRPECPERLRLDREDVSSSASAIECHYLQATALLCISIGTELLCSFLCMLGLSWVAFCFLRQGLTYT